MADYYMLLEPRMVPLGVKEEDFPQPGWRVAFESAFGMTVDEFYDLYEDHRSAGFPEVAITMDQDEEAASVIDALEDALLYNLSGDCSYRRCGRRSGWVLREETLPHSLSTPSGTTMPPPTTWMRWPTTPM